MFGEAIVVCPKAVLQVVRICKEKSQSICIEYGDARRDIVFVVDILQPLSEMRSIGGFQDTLDKLQVIADNW